MQEKEGKFVVFVLMVTLLCNALPYCAFKKETSVTAVKMSLTRATTWQLHASVNYTVAGQPQHSVQCLEESVAGFCDLGSWFVTSMEQTSNQSLYLADARTCMAEAL